MGAGLGDFLGRMRWDERKMLVLGWTALDWEKGVADRILWRWRGVGMGRAGWIQQSKTSSWWTGIRASPVRRPCPGLPLPCPASPAAGDDDGRAPLVLIYILARPLYDLHAG